MPSPSRSRAERSTQTCASMPARMTWRVPVALRRARTSSTRQQEKFTLGTGCTSGPRVSRSSGRVWPRPLGYCSVATTGRPSRRAVVARILMLGEGSEAAVEAAILYRLGHVLRGYPLTSLQVSDSAGDLEDAVVTARGKAQAAHCLLEEPGALGRRRAEAAHLASAHPSVHACSGAGQARALTLARGLDARADGRRGEIDPVEERTGEPGEVLLDRASVSERTF